MPEPLVDLHDVSVIYRSGMPWSKREMRAVADISFTISIGETLGLVGESGSGKSTLGKVCLGLLRPSEGVARLSGDPLFRMGQRRPGMLGAVLQFPEWSLNPRLTVERSIREPLVVAGVGKAEGDARISRLLEAVSLKPEHLQRYPRELSGGQRQRVSLARALVTLPRFIVFDEAVSALDMSVQAQILALIKDLQGQFGFGALFISHDLGATRAIADRIMVLRQGRAVMDAPSGRYCSATGISYVDDLLSASGLLSEERDIA